MEPDLCLALMPSVRFGSRSIPERELEVSLILTVVKEGHSMFQRNVQWFVDRIMERLVPSIGSFMASAMQRMLILSHAEHHNQLEEQALRYEAAGRLEIAEQIRQQARTMSLDKPLPGAQAVLENFDAANPALFEATQPGIAPALPDARRQKGRRRADDASNDSDGEQS